MMRFLILLFVSIHISGCSWVAWRGYVDPVTTPAPGSYVKVPGGCFEIGVQNLNLEQKKAILEAAAVVCSVWKSREFQTRVTSQTWLASCDLKDNGAKDLLSGEQVFNQLQKGLPEVFSINPRNPWMAIAQAQRSDTDHTRNRVAIEPNRISAWYAAEGTESGELINTFAHEVTHLISSQFRDSGHGSDKCPDAKLVSYGIGNLTEELVK